MAVKALVCELPSRLGVPLSRFHVPDLAAEAVARGIVAQISGTTIWRWLAEDAIRPWARRSWIFPRDPDFEAKAVRVLDLYARCWDGKPLGKRDFVLVMSTEPSASARRVFWVVDNGSSRRGQAAARRLTADWPNAILVPLPVHASWLNQVSTSPLSSAKC